MIWKKTEFIYIIKMLPLVEILIFSLVLHIGITQDVINNKKFPSNFWFGASTAAYQIEGGWNADGKGENVWDHNTHADPSIIADGSNGDIACDSYHKYKEDVAILKNLGVDAYRFSLAWTRILPNGFADNVNQPGVTYYKNLIKELKDNNIEPIVTLMHYDPPQAFQQYGGLLNASFVDWFADYARVAFQLFGDDVKYWLTINEANAQCLGTFLGDVVSGIDEYECGKILIKAHAAAWHVYDDEFRAAQGGQVTIVIAAFHQEPASNSTEDIEAAERVYQWELGWFTHPLYFGDYPEIMKTRIAARSLAQGFNKSRLPEFTPEESLFIQGTLDFFALNTYTTYLIAAIPENISDASIIGDVGVIAYQNPDWPSGASSWLKIVPWGMRKILNYIKDHYNSPEIRITENGFSDNGTTLEDDLRIYYIQNYLSNVRDAIEDGVNVTAYMYWSLIDNFEWTQGYTQKFGVYHVDFNSPNRTRTPKKGVSYYQQVISTHCLVDECTE